MKLFIERPILTIFVMIGLALAGFFSLLKLPVADLPAIDSPVITIYATYPGANPDTVLKNLTTPLEKALQSIPGVQNIFSNSHLGGTTITLEFDYNEDMDRAEQRVEKAVYQAQSRLPAEMSHTPIISRQNFDTGRVLSLILYSDTLSTNDLFVYAERKIKPLLNRINGVASIDIWGMSNQISIAVDPHLLRAYKIPLDNVMTKISSLKGNNPLGSLKTGIKSLKLELLKPDLTLKNLNDIEIAPGPIRLKNVASVEFSKKGSATIRYVKNQLGQDGVLVSVQKQTDANTVAISKQIRSLLPKMTADLPKAIHLELYLDRAKWIEESIWDVELSLILAVFLVALVIYATLGRFRETLIPTLALILSVLGTFIVMKWLGFQLDLLSLLALTLAVGFVVDDAIVVMENILRQREKGVSAFEASLIGAREILFTVISITISLIAVFMPLLFMGGMNELLFREFSITLIIGIVISGVVSITITPMLSRFLIKNQSSSHTGTMDFFVPFYKNTLSHALKHPYWVASTGLVTLILTFILGSSLEINLFPSEDRGVIHGYIQYPEGISGEQSSQLHKELETLLTPINGADAFVLINYPNSSVMSLKSKIPVKKMVSEIENALAEIPGIKVSMYPLQLIEKVTQSSQGGSLQYEMQGFEFPELHETAIALEEILEENTQIKSIRKNFNPHNPTLLIRINEDQARPMGVSTQNVEKIIQQLFSGNSLGLFKVEGSDYDINLSLKSPYKSNVKSLGLLTIPNNEGSPVALNTFTTVEEKLSPDALRQKDLLPSVKFSFEIAEGIPIQKGLETLKNIAESVMSDGLSGEFTGLAKLSTEARNNTLILMVSAILVMYFVLGMLYESFIHPLTILSSIPLAAFGGVITLLFFGEPLSLFSIVGFLLLIGIVKKNGIMMVDFALTRQRQGFTAKDAIIDACATRFRPIMMTTFAAMMGALPIALGIGEGSDTRQGLGWVIFGGLAISQVLTLYVTPAFYLIFDRTRQ